MAHSEERLESLLQVESLRERAKQLERRTLIRSAVLSLLPVALAAVLLGFTVRQIQQASNQLDSVSLQLQIERTQLIRTQQELTATRELLRWAESRVAELEREAEIYQQESNDLREERDELQRQLDDLREERDELQRQLDDLNKTLEGVTEQLMVATDFRQYVFTGDFPLSLKFIHSDYPRQAEVLMKILDMQYEEVPWRLGGFSPVEGFDSPSLVAYVLGELDLLADPESVRYRLDELLQPTTFPQMGDVVFYEEGYTMFYFEDPWAGPFVAGMTPFGILGLKPDFAPVLGFGSVDYYSTGPQ